MAQFFRVTSSLKFLSAQFCIAARFFRAAIIVFIIASYVGAQTKPSGNSLPSPETVLGFVPGADRTIADWRQITDYFTRLDAASNRVKLERIGTSTLGKPLIVAFISAPENIARLSEIQRAQQKLADPRLLQNPNEIERLKAEGKTVVAISCSIHSTEIVASQMSMQLAYDLANANDAVTLDILRNTVLLLIPSPNPDGVDIVANWYRKTLNTPYEGSEPPELYHYYAGHDNNRDWFMLNLPETRAITQFFWRAWYPQIVYDVHQMGQAAARLCLPPFYDPSNPRIHPTLLRAVGTLGYQMATDLQAAGHKGVITNAIYDTWWHGGFRSAPYYHNSIGILSEAASARLMSPAKVSREQLQRSRARGMTDALTSATNFPDPWLGGDWHPRDIMSLELDAAHSLLAYAARYRREILSNFYAVGRENINSKPTATEPLAYVIYPAQGNNEAVAKMLTALIEQGVEVQRLDRELHLEMPQHNTAEETHAGSYIIFLNQPYRNNILALFETQRYPDRINANGEAERPYDVTGWTLPLMMGVEAHPVTAVRETSDVRHFTLLKNENDVRRDLRLPLAATNGKSPLVNPLKTKVRVGLYQSWTADMDEGWTRFALDNYNLPYSSVRDAEMRAGNLRARYDALILPAAARRQIVEGNSAERYPKEYTGGIGAQGVENLVNFVNAGGTLICFDDSCELAIEAFKLPLKNVLKDVPSAKFYAPGTVVKINLTGSAQALTQTMPTTTYGYFINSSAFAVTDEAQARETIKVAARYGAIDELLGSGWILGGDLLAGQIALAEADYGKGRIILFGFRPQHRAQTWATYPLIFNALNSSVK